MKKLLIIILLFAGTVSAQVDSSLVKVNVNIQARDLEYIGAFIGRGDEQFEDMYDAVKAKFRVTNTPSGNTSVAVDSITVGGWMAVARSLQGDQVAVAGGVFGRIDVILRAKNNVWLTGKLNEALAALQAQYVARRLYGRNKLSRK